MATANQSAIDLITGVTAALPSVRSGHSEQLHLPLCGLKNISHRDFQLAFLRITLALTGQEL
jgi:hypothetical protein